MKKRLRIFIRLELAEYNKEIKMMKNHIHQSIHDILRTAFPDGRKLEALNKSKSHIVRLNANRLDWIPLENDIQDKFEDEETSLFHPVMQTERKQNETIRNLKVAKQT
jgi:hypothetical protein